MQSKKIKIKEAIVCEGRDDVAAINQAVVAVTIPTHGYGISQETWDKLKNAYESIGLIVFTDPDFAGMEIRKRIIKKFPNCKEAFLTRREATKGKDIGIENAKPEDILEALKKAKCSKINKEKVFTEKDLYDNKLIGSECSFQMREEIGKKLGIGYANGKGFLKKLNNFDISKKEFEKAIKEYYDK